MIYDSLIGKFMRIFPSKKDLMVCVKSLWKVKIQVDLKFGSKGFFIEFFLTPRIGIESSRRAHIFLIQQVSTSNTRWKYLLQRNMTSR